MKQDEITLDEDVEELLQDNRKPIVSPGSLNAVNRDAPVVTGDGAMDTQLENMRRLLSARVTSIYRLVLRAKTVRLWAVHREGITEPLPPTIVKRDDHPLIAVLIRQAHEVAKIGKVDCQGDAKLELQQIALQLKAFTDIQRSAKEIEALGTDALRQAQDLIKAFHLMAQQYKIHRDKLDAGSDQSDSELLHLAMRVKSVSTPKLEAFIDPQ